MGTLSFAMFLKKYLPEFKKSPSFVKNITIAFFLVKKYHKIIFLPKYQEKIQSIDGDLWYLILFLKDHGLRDKKYLNLIVRELNKDISTIHFVLEGPNFNQENIINQIDSFLQKKFSDYYLQESEKTNLGITLKGGGYHYKRNLDSDLDILLQ